MVLSSQLVRPQVYDGSNHSFQNGELGAQSQSEKHNEEQDRPERSDGQPGDSFRINGECESSALRSDLFDGRSHFECHESNNAKDYEASEKSGEHVACCDDDCVPITAKRIILKIK